MIKAPTATLAKSSGKPTWLRSPQRVFLRRALFQVHLWTGLVLLIYAVVIGLTGSALIFKDELLHRLEPQIYRITPVSQQVSLDTAVKRIERDRPGWTAFALRDFDKRTQATDLLMRKTEGPPSPNYRIVSFNPYTSEVLMDHLRYAGLLGFTSNLHVYLLSGARGLLVSGWMAVGLLLLCVTGLILWWPGVQRWTRSLVLNRGASWRRTNWELHTVIGFWTSAAFVLVVGTGIDFAFPDTSGRLIELITGHGYRDTGSPLIATPARSDAARGNILSLDEAIAASYRALPADAPPGYLSLPSTPSSPFHATGYYKDAAPYSQLVRILLDSGTGALLAKTDTRDQDFGSRAEQSFVALHFGLFAGSGILGVAVKILWVLLGIVPAMLAVTGALMYWNRTLRPLWIKMTARSNDDRLPG